MAASNPIPTNTRFQNLCGQTFGHMVVIEFAGTTPLGLSLWVCRCDCGKIKTVRGSHLKSGNTKGCGCLIGKSRKHGMSTTSTYGIWRTMKTRCSNPKFKFYYRHGGRGIRVCKRWQKFENFLEDMGERPPGLSLERQDNNGDYEPGNVVWATPKQQAANRRSNGKKPC